MSSFAVFVSYLCLCGFKDRKRRGLAVLRKISSKPFRQITLVLRHGFLQRSRKELSKRNRRSRGIWSCNQPTIIDAQVLASSLGRLV
jgi:hypothetical protein